MIWLEVLVGVVAGWVLFDIVQAYWDMVKDNRMLRRWQGILFSGREDLFKRRHK